MKPRGCRFGRRRPRCRSRLKHTMILAKAPAMIYVSQVCTDEIWHGLTLEEPFDYSHVGLRWDRRAETKHKVRRVAADAMAALANLLRPVGRCRGAGAGKRVPCYSPARPTSDLDTAPSCKASEYPNHPLRGHGGTADTHVVHCLTGLWGIFEVDCRSWRVLHELCCWTPVKAWVYL